MKYTKEDLNKYHIWKHLKTNNLYYVLGIAICATNGEHNGDLSVVYGSDHGWFYRKMEEFLDGRFEPVPVQTTGG